MKYIQCDHLYLAEDFSKYLQFNIYEDYSKKILNFRAEDIAYVRLIHFSPYGVSHKDTEVNNKKKFEYEENFFAISDSVLNIITMIMTQQKFKTVDLMPILRLKHFNQINERINSDPVDLSERKNFFDKLFNFKKEYVALLFNEEEQKTLAEYVLIDENNRNENIWLNYAEKGYLPIFIEEKINYLKIYEKLSNIISSKKGFDVKHIYPHPYNKMGNKPFSEIEKEATQNRFFYLKSLVADQYERYKDKYLKKELTLSECLDYFDIAKENFDDYIEVFNQDMNDNCVELNLFKAINTISLGDYSFSELEDMQDIHIHTLNEYKKIINKRKDFFEFVDLVKIEFEKEALNSFQKIN